MKVNETFVKYLAGLCDSDGTLTFNVCNGCLRLHLSIANDKRRFEKLTEELLKEVGGKVYEITPKSDKHAVQLRWFLTKRADLEMLLPRLIKHLVIKGKHWNWLYNVWREFRGKALDEGTLKALKDEAKKSREDTGSVKAKSHPSWAWAAGYLDGDGCYSSRQRIARGVYNNHITVRCHFLDFQGVQLLHKAFGGSLNSTYQNGTEILVWHRGLGRMHIKFAERFLGKMWMHSRMKRHQIEKILHTNKQRLTENTPEGEVIV